MSFESTFKVINFGSWLCTDDPDKVNHLLKLEGAKERLQLFKADLLEEGSFDSAVDGCECVFHTASPLNFDIKDPKVCHFVYISVDIFFGV